MEVTLAVDVGGTKIEAGLVDDNGTMVTRVRADTPRDGDAESLFAAVVALVDEARSHGKPEVVGVGCGGPMSPLGELVSPLNIPAWRDFPLRSRLEEHTDLPVYVDNDAKALALGEGWVGAARDVRNFIAMVVSTGVGGGIVLNGRLLEGAAGNAGHIGHVIAVPNGRACPCGAHGCLESEASGIAIREITGRPPAEADAATIERTGTLVGQVVGSVANLLDLRLAVIAGSVALGFGEPFFAAAQAEVDRVAQLEFARGVRVEPAGLRDGGPLIGAAAVALRATAHPAFVR